MGKIRLVEPPKPPEPVQPRAAVEGGIRAPQPQPAPLILDEKEIELKKKAEQEQRLKQEAIRKKQADVKNKSEESSQDF
jgi:hypothetical protein